MRLSHDRLAVRPAGAASTADGAEAGRIGAGDMERVRSRQADMDPDGPAHQNARSHIVHLPKLNVKKSENSCLGSLSKPGWVFNTGLGDDNPVSGFGPGRQRIAAATG